MSIADFLTASLLAMLAAISIAAAAEAATQSPAGACTTSLEQTRDASGAPIESVVITCPREPVQLVQAGSSPVRAH